MFTEITHVDGKFIGFVVIPDEPIKVNKNIWNEIYGNTEH